jgi:hypothetical protein
MIEIWKQIKGHEGRYEVSNLGRVRSVDAIIPHSLGPRKWKGRVLIPQLAGGSPLKYQFINLGKNKPAYVHRLVAEAFVPNPLNLPEVNHIKGKSDNSASNLEWSTHSNNMKHAGDNGLMRRGEGCAQARLTNEIVLAIRQAREQGESYRSISKKFGTSIANATRIARRVTWKHLR